MRGEDGGVPSVAGMAKYVCREQPQIFQHKSLARGKLLINHELPSSLFSDAAKTGVLSALQLGTDPRNIPR